MNIFLICPVRNITDEFKEKLEKYIVVREEVLEDEVYYPARDTDQEDPNGLRICKDNLDNIWLADEVHVAWDGKSQGCLFDLGMAFALKKKIVPVVFLFPEKDRNGKSFHNMLHELYRRGM